MSRGIPQGSAGEEVGRMIACQVQREGEGMERDQMSAEEREMRQRPGRHEFQQGDMTFRRLVTCDRHDEQVGGKPSKHATRS